MKSLQRFDKALFAFFSPLALPIAKLSLFAVFFWFGLLKVLLVSPAAGLVEMLQVQTLPWFNSVGFLVTLGAIEMIIGIAFLIPRITKFAIFLMVLHMITTFLPLIFLPEIAWQAPFIPTLEGQYILKNLVLLALALQIGIRQKERHE